MDNRNTYLGFAVIAAIIAVIIFVLMQPREDSSTKLGRAADEISEGIEDAGRELDPNRTTGEKIGDAVEDLGEDIQDASEQ